MFKTFKNIWKLGKLLNYFEVSICENNTVTFYHKTTGSFVEFNKTGTVAIHAAGHLDQTTKGAILQNCDRNFAQMTLEEMQDASKRNDAQCGAKPEFMLSAVGIGDRIQYGFESLYEPGSLDSGISTPNGSSITWDGALL
jgi:hypothetical protein